MFHAVISSAKLETIFQMTKCLPVFYYFKIAIKGYNWDVVRAFDLNNLLYFVLKRLNVNLSSCSIRQHFVNLPKISL